MENFIRTKIRADEILASDGRVEHLPMLEDMQPT